MKIVAFDGSPRKNGNSTMLLRAFLEQFEDRADINVYKTDELNIKPCRGCLMCNKLKRCAIRHDEWAALSHQILCADVLAFSTPVYFHHTTASMKKLIDRFRSFLHVQITEEGVIHTTHEDWRKKLFLFTAHGSSSPVEARPLNELFQFMTEALGPGNELKIINGLRLAVSAQIGFNKERMLKTYEMLGLPADLVDEDLKKNSEWLDTARRFADEI